MSGEPIRLVDFDANTTDAIGRAWRHRRIGIGNESREIVATLPQAVATHLFDAWFCERKQCTTCQAIYREADNFQFACHYHPAPFSMITETYLCCDVANQASRGCTACDHIARFTGWSTQSDASDGFFLDAVPVCLLGAMSGGTPPPRVLLTVNSFADEELPQASYASIPIAGPYLMQTWDRQSAMTLPYTLPQPLSTVDRFGRINEALRYESTSEGYYTQVDREFVPYHLVCRVAEWKGTRQLF